jgi:hypothetical protein
MIPRRKGNPRICLAPTEISGYYGRLTAALRDLGVDAVHVNLTAHPFAYPEAATPPFIVRLTSWCRRRNVSQRTWAIRLMWGAIQGPVSAALLVWALVRFDTFVFGFARTFLRLHELAMLKRLGKRIIFVLHGSDSRPAYLNGAVTLAPWDVEEVIARTRAQKRRLARIERYADAVVCDPMSCHLLESPIVLRPLIGRPTASISPPISNAQLGGRRVRVLHAPSDPAGKGTHEIRRIFSSLQAQGHDVEFVEVNAQPNSIVLDEIARCDFVADQLYADTPMATLATEAALFGKPALVGGYAREHYSAAMPAGTVPPTTYVDPSEFKAAAERLLRDPELRKRLGHEAHEFVSLRWAPAQVAGRFLQLVEGDIPDEWSYDPATLRYTHGHGLTEDQVRERVAAVVDAGGVAALQVADKPELERSLVELASTWTSD